MNLDFEDLVKYLGIDGIKINKIVEMKYYKKMEWNSFHSFVTKKYCEIIIFIFYLFSCGIGGMSIPFHLCQITIFFLKLIE